MFKTFFRIALFLLPLVILGCVQEPSQSSFVFEELEHDFGVIKQSGGLVSHEFAFTYQGEDPITVTSTPGSCLCITAEIDKNQYELGEEGVLTVFFNPNLHAEPEGRFYKTVSIFTETEIISIPEVRVWQEIDLDLGEEAFELSAKENPHSHEEGDEHDLLEHESSG